MNLLTKALQALLILLVTMALAILLGFGLILLITELEEPGTWEQLDRPPGGVVRLLTANDNYVVVETAEGKAYRVFCHTDDPLESCYREVDAEQEDSTLSCRDSVEMPSPRFRFRQSRGETIGPGSHCA